MTQITWRAYRFPTIDAANAELQRLRPLIADRKMDVSLSAGALISDDNKVPVLNIITFSQKADAFVRRLAISGPELTDLDIPLPEFAAMIMRRARQKDAGNWDVLHTNEHPMALTPLGDWEPPQC